MVARISYPELARQHGVAGAVTIDFMIDVDGSIFDARVVQSPDWDDAPVSAVAALKREALRVANTLTFTPAMKDGETIQIGMLFPLVFELD